VPSATTGPAPVAASSGAPDQGMTVPPTRPSTYARAGRPLPVTKKQMMIAGVGLVALVVIVALVAGGGSKQAEAPETGAGSAPAAAVDEQPKSELAQVVARASALIASEDYGEAVAVLRRARKANPKSAELAFLSGKANFGRLWWSDGIADFREAIQLDSRYREDPELLKTVLKGFITTPDVDARIVGFMREIGPPLRPYLEETAEKHPKKLIRARARAELDARP
jgi:hypothetical protein